MYSYSGAILTQITPEGVAPIADNSLSYNFPAYSATVFVLAGAPAAQQLIANAMYTVKNLASSPALDDPGRSTKAGTQMIQWPANNQSNQHWVFGYAGGAYTIQNTSRGLYLTGPNTQGEAHASLVQQPYSSTNPAQLWSISGSAGNYVLHNKATALVIADPNSSKSATGIILETAISGANESWSIQ